MIIERCGPEGNVLKVIPPLTSDDEVLEEGLGLLEEALAAVRDRCPKESLGSLALGGSAEGQ